MAEEHIGRIHAFVRMLGTNRWTVFGASLATTSAAAIFVVFALLVFGLVHHGYAGLVLFLVLPVLFLLGLVAIPFGLWRFRVKGGVRPSPKGPPQKWPVFDFNQERTREIFTVFLVLTGANIVILSLISFEGVAYSESTQFCGTACHTVMQPHNDAFLDSPHASIDCVDCHVGEGVSGFLSAKLSGVRQLYEVALGTYPTPVPTLRHEEGHPVLEACQKCHSSTNDRDTILDVSTKHLEDEANTPTYSVLLFEMGSLRSDSGIHGWHNQPGRTIEFLADTESPEVIKTVRVTEEDGGSTEYKMEGEESSADTGVWRTMTCIDCHNRVGHDFDPPAQTIDRALSEGRIDRSLPYIKSTGIQILSNAAEEFAVSDSISEKIRSFYEDSYPELFEANTESVHQAVATLQDIYERNVYPDMKVTWETYADFSGHTHSVGCFRCHDDAHKSPDGQLIRQDCLVCHNLLAWDEESPEVFEEWGLGAP